jgi:four helix bundle protein
MVIMQVDRLKAFRGQACVITSQIRRAAVSVPSNIVEGCARDSEAEHLRFLNIAFGSLRELRYQLSLSKRLGFLRNEDLSLLEPKVVETEKVLNGLIRALRDYLESLA